MSLSDILASTGVLILLIAFVLNLMGKMKPELPIYSLMNFIGAILCGISSYLISFYPFVILESVWATAALIAFIKNVPRGTYSKIN